MTREQTCEGRHCVRLNSKGDEYCADGHWDSIITLPTRKDGKVAKPGGCTRT